MCSKALFESLTGILLLIKLPGDLFASPERDQPLPGQTVLFINLFRCDFPESHRRPSHLLRGERSLIKGSAVRADKSFELIQSSKSF